MSVPFVLSGIIFVDRMIHFRMVAWLAACQSHFSPNMCVEHQLFEFPYTMYLY